jgi:SpoVK/Ycf46/Vps4 family AAA+-type ATPase
MNRAAARSAAGDAPGAAQLYALAVRVAGEGLALRVPTSGLGPAACTAAAHRADLTAWAAAAADAAAGRGPAVGAVPTRTAPVPGAAPPPPRRASSPVRAAPRASPPGRQQPATAASSEAGRLAADVLADALDTRPPPPWDSVVGLDAAKAALREAVLLPTLRADLFTGLRRPARGILLYGPPGNGKTLLVRALAGEAKAALLSVSSASLTSRWHGEGEKLIRALFAAAAAAAPSIIFIDEADALLSARGGGGGSGGGGEHEASRRMKTEFLTAFDRLAAADGGSGAATAPAVTVICATNRPADLDDAVRRRLTRRILVPLPDTPTRRDLLARLLAAGGGSPRPAELDMLAAATAGYSHADLTAAGAEAAMAPLRELGERDLARVPARAVRGVTAADFADALAVVKASASAADAAALDAWTEQYGTRG